MKEGNFSGEALILKTKALEIMRNSKDPTHDLSHIESIISQLDRFLEETPESLESLNSEVLMLAIFWHDVWKAQRFPTSPISFVTHQIVEGLASMYEFRREAISVGLYPETREEAEYAIRKHSFLQITKAKTLPAQLLWDLDKLEEWNFERYKNGGGNFFLIHDRKYARTFMNYMKLRKFPRFHFEWSSDQFPETRARFIQSFEEFLSGR